MKRGVGVGGFEMFGDCHGVHDVFAIRKLDNGDGVVGYRGGALSIGLHVSSKVSVLKKGNGIGQVLLFELRFDVRIFHPFGLIGNAFIVQDSASWSPVSGSKEMSVHGVVLFHGFSDHDLHGSFEGRS